MHPFRINTVGQLAEVDNDDTRITNSTYGRIDRLPPDAEEVHTGHSSSQKTRMIISCTVHVLNDTRRECGRHGKCQNQFSTVVDTRHRFRRFHEQVKSSQAPVPWTSAVRSTTTTTMAAIVVVRRVSAFRASLTSTSRR